MYFQFMYNVHLSPLVPTLFVFFVYFLENFKLNKNYYEGKVPYNFKSIFKNSLVFEELDIKTFFGVLQ